MHSVAQKIFRIVIIGMLMGLATVSYAQDDDSSAVNEPRSGKDSTGDAEDASDRFKERTVQGWTVRIYQEVLKHRDLKAQVLDALTEQLKRVSTRVPDNARDELRKVPIWVFYDKPGHDDLLAYYDPGVGAVVFHKARRLSELLDYKNAVVMHELAHGYHHQVLGYGNPDIMRAYKDAMDSGRYKSVASIYGTGEQEAYATKNHIEYFAEVSEAFFSKENGKFRNDFYPFTRRELKEYDPEGYAMVRKLWRQ